MKKPFVGITAFLIVLLTMPLGHAAMILIEKCLGESMMFFGAGAVGFLGLGLLLWGTKTTQAKKATFLGLFAGLLIWTGWVEFAFVYYAQRQHVMPLMENGKIVTKPEYLIMPSSIGFWSVLMIYYILNARTGCPLFMWIQRKMRIKNLEHPKKKKKKFALSTTMEIILILWTFYLLLLIIYDPHFFGDKHVVTYGVALGSLLWSVYLFIKLIRMTCMAYAIRYAIPTVIIFWNFVEILGRWDVFTELWIHPFRYSFEIIALLVLMILLILLHYLGFNKAKANDRLEKNAYRFNR